MSVPSHYEVLGLPVTAGTEEIEQRCQELMRLYAADGSDSAMARHVAEARRVLTNPALRGLYDSGRDGASTSAPLVASPLPEATTALPADVDRTQAWTPPPLPPTPTAPRTAQEPTVAFPGPPAPAAAPSAPAVPAAPADADLARELARRGVDSAEVQRLLSLERGMKPAVSAKAAARIATPPLPPPSPKYVPKPTISLPAPREADPKERLEADRQLTAANLARRRGNFAEAETLCRAALELTPKDAAALEMYGDILQALGRVDDAHLAYERATEVDPKRASAEKKFAELRLAQNRGLELLRDESVPGSPLVAVLLSGVIPGAGQIYNGHLVKGVLTLVAALACVILIFWSPLGIPSGRTGIPTSLIVLIAAFALIFIFAVADANKGARGGRGGKSGWEV